MQTPQTSQHSWPPRWPLAIDRHASMPACHNRNAGMLGCTQAAQTDQHFLPPPLLAGHRPALQEGAKNSGVSVLLACTLAYQHPSCWHAGMLACWLMASQKGRGARMLVYLCYWGAPQHASIPSCWHVGMLACWSMVSQRGRGRKMLACLCCWHAPQHASTPSCWHAGMLGCKPAAQTDQHDNDRGAGRSSVAVAVDACVYPSTQHPAPCHFGVHPRMMALWPCT